MSETVGEQLRSAREARKLTLDQVYQVTRIAVRYLKGLEEDQPDLLPSPVQGRGFLRLYADFLGLPVQKMIDSWEGEPPPEATEIIPKPEQAADNLPVEDLELVEETELPALVIEPELPMPAVEMETVTQSQAIYHEIGEVLHERRESLGLTLSDVERFTKLRQHYLQALETGAMKDLPSMVQGRGMLNNYAHFLELDAEAILLRFADALQRQRIENMPPPPERGLLRRAIGREPTRPAPKAESESPNAPHTSMRTRRLFTPDIFLGGLILVGLAVFIIWAVATVSSMRTSAAAAITPPPIANLLIATATAPALIEGSGPPLSAVTVPPNAEVGNVPIISDSNGDTTPTELPIIGDAPLQVYVVAKQRAWLRVSEDDKIKYNGRVIPGNAYPFSGKEKIELVSGNAAAFQIFFNQQDLGALGVNGQLLSLIFGPQGVVTPTPSFSPSPTITLIPTLTPKPSPTQPTPTVTPFIP